MISVIATDRIGGFIILAIVLYALWRQGTKEAKK